jgi:GTP-binding protein Era
MERAMVGAAFDAIAEGDCVLHLVDVTHKNVLENNKIILNKLPKGVPVILALNKVDRIEKTKLLDITAELNAAFDYEQTFMISALKGSGLKDLMGYLANKMPEGPWHYDEDQITTMPLRMWAAEITREKIFEQLHKELPYAILVETELWEDFDNGDLKISQAITVERTSQKAIILGKGGSRIREIGKAARLDLEDQLERRVHMKLFVRVQENWQDRPESYQIMGLSE